MTEKKRKRRSPIGSVVAIMICFSLLLGTTFAWFTDQVNSVENVIQAGNLDVELYHTSASVTSDTLVKADTDLFLDINGEKIEWEPGVVAWENFIVKNEGTLALKYKLGVLFKDLNHVASDTDDGKFVLSDALSVAIVEGGVKGTTREAVLAEVNDTNTTVTKWESLEEFSYTGELEPKDKENDSKTYGMVIYWQPGEDDNNWNVNNDKTVDWLENPADYGLEKDNFLRINLGIKLEATQQPYEEDSFDKNYDEEAAIPTKVTGADELKTALETAKNGDVIVLEAAEYGFVAIEGKLSDVTIQGSEGANVRLNIGSTAVLNDVTITDLGLIYETTSGAYVDGGAINIDAGADVNNLVIENSTFNGSGGRSCVVGCSEPTAEITLSNCVIDGPKYVVYGSAPVAKLTIEDCEIKNISSWVAILNAGDSVGAKLTISDCTLDNCKGGIAKFLGSSTPDTTQIIFTDNTLTNCTGHDGKDTVWFTLPVKTTQVTVSNNTLDGAAWTPGTAQGLGK